MLIYTQTSKILIGINVHNIMGTKLNVLRIILLIEKNRFS